MSGSTQLNYTLNPLAAAGTRGQPAAPASSAVLPLPVSLPVAPATPPKPLSPGRVIPLTDGEEKKLFSDFLAEVRQNPKHLEKLFKKFTIPEFVASLTGGATCTEDVIADFSMFVRNFMPDSASTQAVGVTTGENVFQGWYTVYKAWHAFKKARQLNDRAGMFTEGTNIFYGTGQTIGGAAYLGIRGTSIAAQVMSNPPAALVQACNILGLIGNVAFTVLYLGIGILGAYLLDLDILFSFEMAKKAQNLEVFDFLLQKAFASTQRKLFDKLNEKLKPFDDQIQKMKKEIGELKEKKSPELKGKEAALVDLEADREKCKMAYEEKIQGYRLELEKVVDERLKETGLSESQIKDLKDLIGNTEGFKGAFEEILRLQRGSLGSIQFTALQALGLSLDAGRRQLKKEAKFSRLTSGGSVADVQKAARRGLSERLKSEDSVVKKAAETELNKLNGRVVSENKSNMVQHAALIALAILGVTVMVLGFFSVLPLAALVASIVITAVLALGMLAVDGNSMVTGWNEGKPGKNDRAYIIAISAVMLVAMIVSVGLTFGFALPVLPAFIALGLGTASLGMAGVSMYKLEKKEEAWIENHPDLERIAGMLSEKMLDEKVEAVFKKLTSAERQAVRKKYKALSAVDPDFGRIRSPLDVQHDFGGRYISEITDHVGNEKEQALMVKAMRKTTKFFWEKWYQSKSDNDRDRAIKMQSLFERVVQKNRAEIPAKLSEVDGVASNRLKEDLWYVFKRQESQADLKKAIHAVLEDRRKAEAQAKSEEQKAIPAD